MTELLQGRGNRTAEISQSTVLGNRREESHRAAEISDFQARLFHNNSHPPSVLSSYKTAQGEREAAQAHSVQECHLTVSIVLPATSINLSLLLLLSLFPFFGFWNKVYCNSAKLVVSQKMVLHSESSCLTVLRLYAWTIAGLGWHPGIATVLGLHACTVIGLEWHAHIVAVLR